MSFPMAEENLKLIQEVLKNQELTNEESLASYLLSYMNPDTTGEQHLQEFVRASYQSLVTIDSLMENVKKELRNPQNDTHFEQCLQNYSHHDYLQSRITVMLSLLHNAYEISELYDLSRPYSYIEQFLELHHVLPAGAYIRASLFQDTDGDMDWYEVAHVHVTEPMPYDRFLEAVVYDVFMAEHDVPEKEKESLFTNYYLNLYFDFLSEQEVEALKQGEQEIIEINAGKTNEEKS